MSPSDAGTPDSPTTPAEPAPSKVAPAAVDVQYVQPFAVGPNVQPFATDPPWESTDGDEVVVTVGLRHGKPREQPIGAVLELDEFTHADAVAAFVDALQAGKQIVIEYDRGWRIIAR